MSEIIKDWKELWLKNYRGEGATEGLQKLVKTLTYGSRDGVSYLGWATVERIFKFQDGEYEAVISPDGNFVHIDRAFIKNDEEGIPLYMNSYFIVIKARWQGQEHIETYPLQDSNGRPLSFWTQNDINKAVQRAKVKAIAMVSGIGYKLYEDGDLQFEDDGKDGTKAPKVEEPAPVKPKSPKKPDPVKTVEPVVEPVVEPPVEDEKVSEPAEQTVIPAEEESVVYDDTKTEAKAEEITLTKTQMIERIKTEFLQGGIPKVTIVRNSLNKYGAKKIDELDDAALRELYVLVTAK